MHFDAFRKEKNKSNLFETKIMRNKKESEPTCGREENKNEIFQRLVVYEWLAMFFYLPSSWVELIFTELSLQPRNHQESQA